MLQSPALIVSPVFVALCALILFALTAWVGLRRGAVGILRGTGTDPVLEKRSRMHGNFIENAPITALAVLMAELLGLASLWLWIAVASFFVGRLLHFALYDHKARGAGMLLTQAPGALLGLWVIARIV